MASKQNCCRESLMAKFVRLSSCHHLFPDSSAVMGTPASRPVFRESWIRQSRFIREGLLA
jgi:hypothetical protein